jgi:hypothetical protein
MKIGIKSFKGIAPRYAEKMLPDDMATIADGCELLGGKLQPKALTATVDTSEEAGKICEVQGPIVNDEYKRIYYTDGVGPLMVKGTFDPEREVKFPTPPAPAGLERVKAVEELITEELRAWGVYVYGTKTELTFLELVKDGDRKIARFHFSGLKDGQITGGVLVYPVYQLWIPNKDVSIPVGDSEDESAYYHLLPEKFSSNLSDGSNIEIRSDKNKLIGYCYVESYRTYDSETPTEDSPEATTENTTSITIPGRKVEFILNIAYADTAKDYYYVTRYVDDLGVEGPPSELSERITRYPGEKIRIGDLGASPGGNIQKVRIYRSAGTEQEDGFYFLTELDITATGFIDDLEDEELAEKMPNFGNPPDGLDNLVRCSGGFLAANKGRDIWFSDPYLPHQWPYKYVLNVDNDIVGMASRRNTLVVMTDGKLYLFVGNRPDMMTPVEVAFEQPCLTRRGIVKINGDVFYPSPDGLVAVTDGGFKVLTRGTFRKEDWQALEPATFISTSHDERYVAFAGAGWTKAWIFNLHEDICTSWEQGSMGAVWQSKVFEFSCPLNWNALQVTAEDYPVTVKLLSGGEEYGSYDVHSPDVMRLPLTRREKEWQIRIETDYRVDGAVLATSVREI